MIRRIARPISIKRPGNSTQLATFARDFLDRPLVAAFVQRAAQQTPPGARVLDAGAGSAPYREFFSHCHYLTADWEHSPYPEGRRADIVASLDALPVEAESFDLIVCTGVLHAMPSPASALGELQRVLRRGGKLWLTAPFVWPATEAPHDYWRFTEFGIARLLEESGFVDVRVAPIGGYFTTMTQLLRSGRSFMRRPTRERSLAGRVLGRPFLRMGSVSSWLDERWDRRGVFPISWACTATRP